ncbi:hypothetical protein [Nocardia asteroides]
MPKTLWSKALRRRAFSAPVSARSVLEICCTNDESVLSDGRLRPPKIYRAAPLLEMTYKNDFNRTPDRIGRVMAHVFVDRREEDRQFVDYGVLSAVRIGETDFDGATHGVVFLDPANS